MHTAIRRAVGRHRMIYRLCATVDGENDLHLAGMSLADIRAKYDNGTPEADKFVRDQYAKTCRERRALRELTGMWSPSGPVRITLRGKIRAYRAERRHSAFDENNRHSKEYRPWSLYCDDYYED